MARSGLCGWHGTTLLLHGTSTLALLVLLTSCAVMFNGTTQTVPVRSTPSRAEVFVDGEPVGFTPVELELTRGRSHVVTVRYGEQERVFHLVNEIQGGMVALDLVPAAVGGAAALVVCAFYAEYGGGSSCLAPAVGAIAVGAIPIAVDLGTGAAYRLDHAEIMAVFD